MRDTAGERPRLIRMALTAGLLLLILTLARPAGAYSPAAVAIAACNDTSVALLDDGTVWQWGYGPGGAGAPHQVAIAGVRHISAGAGHVLALKGDGSVWAWGANAHGQLGDGTYNDSAEPVRADIGGVAAIAAGKDNSLALKGDGTVWAWGFNAYGQTGQGSGAYSGSAVPVQVSGLNGIKAVAAGGSHCFAVQGDGTVWAWGENSHGILGDGTNVARFSPVRSKIYNADDLAAGTSHALAVKPDGSVWAWGYNYMGQLGAGGQSLNNQGRLLFGPEADVYNPDVVRGIADVKAVAAGGSHSVALKNDGTVWSWGSNEDGQLGLGAAGLNDQTSPVQVPGFDGATAVAAGMYHTLAIKNDGSVWAWGSNEEGQVGNGSAASTAAPALVLLPPQIPPPATPTPVIAAQATAAPAGANYLLAGAVGLLVVIVIVVTTAIYLIAFRKNEKGKKGP